MRDHLLFQFHIRLHIFYSFSSNFHTYTAVFYGNRPFDLFDFLYLFNQRIKKIYRRGNSELHGYTASLGDLLFYYLDYLLVSNTALSFLHSDMARGLSAVHKQYGTHKLF